MAQEIAVPLSNTPNFQLLDDQLKAAAPADCFGFKHFDGNLSLIVSETIQPALLLTLKNIVAAHDPAQKTPIQQAEITGRADTAAMLAAADKAITDLTAKLTTFQATPNLANAAPLLIEVTQDLIGVIKTMKFIAKRVG